MSVDCIVSPPSERAKALEQNVQTIAASAHLSSRRLSLIAFCHSLQGVAVGGNAERHERRIDTSQCSVHCRVAVASPLCNLTLWIDYSRLLLFRKPIAISNLADWSCF